MSQSIGALSIIDLATLTMEGLGTLVLNVSVPSPGGIPVTATGQQLILSDPKIFVNGVELPGMVKDQDSRLKFYSGTHIVSGPAILTMTTSEENVDLRYTFSGETPTSKSPKYTGSITLRQNKSGDNTVVKVRAFRINNSNITSKIIKGTINAVGGNTTTY